MTADEKATHLVHGQVQGLQSTELRHSVHKLSGDRITPREPEPSQGTHIARSRCQARAKGAVGCSEIEGLQGADTADVAPQLCITNGTPADAKYLEYH